MHFPKAASHDPDAGCRDCFAHTCEGFRARVNMGAQDTERLALLLRRRRPNRTIMRLRNRRILGKSMERMESAAGSSI